MRRMLHILKWLGLSLSNLLLAGTVFCWVWSVGHTEGWTFARVEFRPDWTAPDLAGQGIHRWRSARVTPTPRNGPPGGIKFPIR